VSEVAFAAVGADARRHGQPSTLAVGQRVQIRRTGALGEIKAADDGTCRVLVAADGKTAWMSRLRVQRL